MPALKLRQLEFERDTWKRLLRFMIEENIHLKKRLAEVLSYQFDGNLLEQMEIYNTRFLKQDELISLLRHELAEFDKLLVRETFEDGGLINEVMRKAKTLQKSVIFADEQCREIKTDFNNFLSVMINDSNRKSSLKIN